MLDLLLLIVKCPFNKIKILWWPTIALEKSFRLIYGNTHLNSRETVPLRMRNNKYIFRKSEWVQYDTPKSTKVGTYLQSYIHTYACTVACSITFHGRDLQEPDRGLFSLVYICVCVGGGKVPLPVRAAAADGPAAATSCLPVEGRTGRLWGSEILRGYPRCIRITE